MDKYIGKQFGCYKIIGISDKLYSDGHKQYIGECVHCGYTRIDKINDFKRYTNKNCPHVTLHNNIRYLYNANWGNQRIGQIYNNMVHRCYDIQDKSYKFYGKKGVCVCNEWLTNPLEFEKWAINNGYKDDLTIDRINSNANYCSENCRWITLIENSKWKSTTNYIKVNNILDSGKGWAKRLGLSINYINRYLRNNGMDNTIKLIKYLIDSNEYKNVV